MIDRRDLRIGNYRTGNDLWSGWVNVTHIPTGIQIRKNTSWDMAPGAAEAAAIEEIENLLEEDYVPEHEVGLFE